MPTSEMDPKTQECLGHYLYGAGFYAREDNTLGLATGNGASQPHFCLTCPKRQECEDEHAKRVRELLPEEAELFERQMADARARDIPPTLAAVWLGNKGQDPYMKVAIENFGHGHADRGRRDGALIQ